MPDITPRGLHWAFTYRKEERHSKQPSFLKTGLLLLENGADKNIFLLILKPIVAFLKQAILNVP